MELQNIFESVSNLYTKQRELEAIWLSKPIETPFGRTYRLTKDSLIKIEDGKLVNFTDEPSHKVLACFGTSIDQFEITVVDLKTNEPSQLKI